jgi:hypothetical protein
MLAHCIAHKGSAEDSPDPDSTCLSIMSQVRLILPIYKEKYSSICIRQISRTKADWTDSPCSCKSDHLLVRMGLLVTVPSPVRPPPLCSMFFYEIIDITVRYRTKRFNGCAYHARPVVMTHKYAARVKLVRIEVPPFHPRPVLTSAEDYRWVSHKSPAVRAVESGLIERGSGSNFLAFHYG